MSVIFNFSVLNLKNNLKCNYSAQKFSSTPNTYLRTHKRNVHEGLKAHKCTYCSKEFSQLGSLTLHIKRIHEKRERNEKCHLCDSAFKFKYDLEKHIAGVHNENSYKCEFCSKTFSFKSNMRNHTERIHNKKVNQKSCSFCGKLFYRNDLKDHIKNVHEGIKNHICKICGKGYFDLGNLKTHFKKVHEREEDPKINT